MMNKINKPCNYFATGNCKKGDGCQFLHIDMHVQSGGNNNIGGGGGVKPKINKQCGFYKSGSCRKGENCEYLHGGIVTNDQNIGGGNQNYPNQNSNFNSQGFNNPVNNQGNNININNGQQKGPKTGICRNFLQSKCPNGSNCK
jgi:hypothetical protein